MSHLTIHKHRVSSIEYPVSRIQYPACSIEYRASRIENHGAYGTISTTVESPLQISYLFMQNEPNFPESQMNVNKVLTKDYVNKTLGEHGKNEPKTNPIKANLPDDQMNVTVFYTVDYEFFSNWTLGENKPNSKPIQTQLKPIKCQNKPNTNPIKPNFKRGAYAALRSLAQDKFHTFASVRKHKIGGMTS